MATAPQVRNIETINQLAADGRSSFGFGGSGYGRVIASIDFSAADVENAATQKDVFIPVRTCLVKNFSIWADDLDSGATLTLDVGAAGDDFGSGTPDVDEFIVAATVGQTGGSSATQTAEAKAGVALTTNDKITIDVNAAAAASAGSAGKVYVAFDLLINEGGR